MEHLRTEHKVYFVIILCLRCILVYFCYGIDLLIDVGDGISLTSIFIEGARADVIYLQDCACTQESKGWNLTEIQSIYLFFREKKREYFVIGQFR